MKRSRKALGLSRETARHLNLNAQQLGAVVGGDSQVYTCTIGGPVFGTLNCTESCLFLCTRGRG
jgi:hypothetical protein